MQTYVQRVARGFLALGACGLLACHEVPHFAGGGRPDVPNPLPGLALPREPKPAEATAPAVVPTALAGGFTAAEQGRIDEALAPARALGFELDVRAYSSLDASSLITDVDD